MTVNAHVSILYGDIFKCEGVYMHMCEQVLCHVCICVGL